MACGSRDVFVAGVDDEKLMEYFDHYEVNGDDLFSDSECDDYGSESSDGIITDTPPVSPLVRKRCLFASNGTHTGSTVNAACINVDITDDTSEDISGDDNEDDYTNIERNGAEKYFSEIFASVFQMTIFLNLLYHSWNFLDQNMPLPLIPLRFPISIYVRH